MTEENLMELHKYFDKLYKTIKSQAIFSLGRLKLIDQQRIDDILCCIDVNMPKIFKTYKNKIGSDGKLKHFLTYNNLMSVIKAKPPFIKSNYLINFEKAGDLIKKLETEITNDLKYLERNYPSL